MVCKIQRPVAGNRAQSAVYCKGKFRLSLRLPTGLCLRAIAKWGCKEDAELAAFLRAHRAKIMRIVKEARRTHRGLELLHVVSADGEEVSVVL